MTVHSVYGASSAKRWLTCSASVGMCKGIPEQVSEDAELGTAAHELGEFCLRLGLNTYDCLGMTFNNHKVDVSMANAVQLYVSHVRDLKHKLGVEPMLEKAVVMSSVSHAVFGTGDCLFIAGDTLYSIDYKHGYDPVEAFNNPQTAHYGVSALDTFELWDKIKRVVTTIIQPNVSHKDGSIRSCTYDIAMMREWASRFKHGVWKCENEPEFNAGEHCLHCLASPNCRARFERTVEFAYLNKPLHTLTLEEQTEIFKEIRFIKKHLEKIKETVDDAARKGKQINGYKLVKNRTKRKCIDEEGFVKSACAITQREESEFYNQKLKSMTDCKFLVNNDKVLIDDYFKADEGGTSLAPITDNRPAIHVGSAVGVFGNVNGE